MTRAIAIVGGKKTGKTELGLALCRELKARGLTVCAAKRSGHGFDRGQADTDRYQEICDAVLGSSPSGSFAAWSGERLLMDLLPLARADVLVLEGGKSFGWLPRILTAPGDVDPAALRPGLALARTTPEAPGDAPVESDPAALADLVLRRGFLLPGISCGECGRKGCAGLAAEIVAGTATPDECAATGGDVRVTVEGREVAMKPFVARTFQAVLRALLGELKGYAPGRVRIDLEAEK